ncbi:bifunctional folylpolyglutamate synthase/dihydrofolate synthase [Maricaulaceae bacterium NA33B04]|nr:bifunctional folylpolyglutamate synthase/dihydrofolate synthase [Maricaulaceae bacterium NA33B04]
MTTPESIDSALKRLAQLHPKSIDLSLARIEALLDKLGRPQDRLPPTIHLAGTNGKGSTAAFLRAIAEAAGERVHVYTSPHLVHFNERIVLAGEVVDDARLKAAFDRVEATNGDAPISFFEATTAAAFLLFAENPAERLILETGLGGRLDATNVLDAPQCTVITPVSLDHQGFLGDTVKQIAGEKAGIIKPGAPLVLAPQRPEARSVIDAVAMQIGAPVLAWGEQFRAYPEHGRLTYEEDELLWDLPAPALLGPHQIVNAGVAIAAARLCGYGHDAVREGLKRARWPARMQRLKTGSLAYIANAKGAELWLDGGHNAAAGEVLASGLGQMAGAGDRPLVLISAFSANKDAAAYFQYFTGLASRVIAITFAGGREGSQTAQAVAEAARRAEIPAQTSAGLTEALHDALEDYDQPRIVICGSLYLAGEVLALDDGAQVQSTPG